MFERAQYDKAISLLQEGNYRAAASEFDKFRIQFGDSDYIPYVLFMKGYSLHKDKKRHAAIEIYNEVLDYFPDQIEDAAPALYHLGMAHIDNGDIAKGLEELKSMVEDKDYRNHPLAAGALRQLADNYAKRKQYDLALQYWKQSVHDFFATNRAEADQARSNVTAHYIHTGNYTAYEKWLQDDAKRTDPEHMKWIVDNAMRVGIPKFLWTWKYSSFQQKQRENDLRAFYDYLRSHKDRFEQAKSLWSYYTYSIQVIAELIRDREGTELLINDAVAYLKTIGDDKVRDERYSWLIDRLRNARDFPRARYCISLISNPHLAAYKDFEVTGYGEGDWKKAAARLEDLEKMGDATWTIKARQMRAAVYKDNLARYEDAISLYREINEPPGTLWNIQDAYVRWGKLSEALQTLTEIENFFPKDAANAAWNKAKYLHRSGDGKLAVAAARRVLKLYPDSQASSQAHQLLEEYGIRTGGGLLEE